MQQELKRIQQQMEITFIYVTHDQEEALAMSDTVVVMNEGIIQQIGTPEDIYNEPKNAFVADFIGESNILDGIMREDYVVETFGRRFQCMDKGFAKDEPVYSRYALPEVNDEENILDAWLVIAIVVMVIIIAMNTFMS